MLTGLGTTTPQPRESAESILLHMSKHPDNLMTALTSGEIASNYRVGGVSREDLLAFLPLVETIIKARYQKQGDQLPENFGSECNKMINQLYDGTPQLSTDEKLKFDAFKKSWDSGGISKTGEESFFRAVYIWGFLNIMRLCRDRIC